MRRKPFIFAEEKLRGGTRVLLLDDDGVVLCKTQPMQRFWRLSFETQPKQFRHWMLPKRFDFCACPKGGAKGKNSLMDE